MLFKVTKRQNIFGLLSLLLLNLREVLTFLLLLVLLVVFTLMQTIAVVDHVLSSNY